MSKSLLLPAAAALVAGSVNKHPAFAALPHVQEALPQEAAGSGSAASIAVSEAAPKKQASFSDELVSGMLAGAVAGAAVDLVLYPIDTVKTRLQTNTFKDLTVAELPALYSGLAGSLAGHVPSSAVFFAVYQTSKVIGLEPALGAGSAVAQLLASAAANLAASTIRVPTEVVKTRMQSGAERELRQCVQTIVDKDGPPGLFRGYTAFLLRDLPFDAIEFVAYEQLRLAYMAVVGAGPALADWENALVGALAGGVTGALTTPFDTVRARTMNEAGEEAKSSASLLATLQRILDDEGPAALFKGVQPRVLWLSLGGTVFFATLESANNFFS